MLERIHKRLDIEYVGVGALSPDPRNPRRHSKRQIERLKRGIRTFGFLVPILCDRNGAIIAGHARHMAATCSAKLRLAPSLAMPSIVKKRSAMASLRSRCRQSESMSCASVSIAADFGTVAKMACSASAIRLKAPRLNPARYSAFMG